MSVQKGNKITVNYTMSVDGKKVESSDSTGPLVYVHGEGKIIQGLTSQLEGMEQGEKKEFSIEPKEGYGEADPKAFQEIPKSKLPKNVEAEAGLKLQANMPHREKRTIRIVEVKKESIVIDLNHPLAGKRLDFQVEVLSIK